MGLQDDRVDGVLPHRRSIRLPKHDYSWTGAYFVTMRARTHEPLFEVPKLREILHEQWRALPARFPGVTLDEFVVMPDHVHGTLFLDGLIDNPPTLGRVIGAYKSLTTVEWFKYCKAVNMDAIGPFWLRNYHERVIRDKDELERIRQYIRHNPEKLATREY